MGHADMESGSKTLSSDHDDAIQFDPKSPESKAVRLRTDLVIMPLVTLTFTLAMLDKNGLAYAAVYGMKTDAHLHDQEYSWLGSIFYFGYLFMEFPNMWLISRYPLGKYMGICVFAWGGCVACMAACHNFGGLAAIRFLLGMFEASILPCLILANSRWYRREEQPLRTAFWGNTFAGVFGGILSYAIGHIDGPLSTWRYIFIIYGSVTALFGIVLFYALPDSPSKAWFLSPEQRKVAALRLASNQTPTEQNKNIKWKHIREAVLDVRYWCLAIFLIAQSITNAGVTNFNPLIIAQFGYSKSKTVLMATPQAAVAMVAQASMTAITFFLPNLRCFFWVLASAIAMAGAVMIKTIDPVSHPEASLAGVYLMGFYNVPWVMVLSLQSSNVAGMTKKSFVSVSVGIFYAVGNIVGPQFFLDSQSPTYPLGIGAMMCAFAVMMATGIAYSLLCVFENKRRDRRYGVVSEADAVEASEAAARDDLTDKENTLFRYTY
ncbi:major facilitator superfamily domain-containing protein [Aspergillus pseudoustus]|uniref:Major facilitator superfamily domain-containing protein n=1 Tax=Aspergillus pseudoustus TaxID=1810923 RepID=A0ABR4KD82_9EURO